MSNTSKRSLFVALGGEAALRALVDDFVDRIFVDTMIGFFFRNADRERVKAKEYELAASHLGADVVYTGRSLPEAHGKHPIMGGHFMRRMKILEETLHDHGAPEDVVRHWLAHTERLRPAITSQRGSACDHEAPNAKEPRRLPLAFASRVAAPSPEQAPAQAPSGRKGSRRELPLVGGENRTRDDEAGGERG